MISFYRIYFDQRLSDFSGLKYIFIYSPLPAWEISQKGLADFINGNPDSISFKCVLNKYIYGIVRYMPMKEEMRLPIEQFCLYDLFVFPTPIQNKVPSYISTTSIKSMQPFAIKNKIVNMDQFTYSKVDKLIKGKDDKWSGIEGWYKKTYAGVFKVLAPNDQNKATVSSWYQKRLAYHTAAESPFHKMTIENLSVKNVCQVPTSTQNYQQLIPQLRVIDSTAQSAMTNQQKKNAQVNFNLPTMRFLSFLNPARNTDLNPWLRSMWYYSRDDRYYYQTWRALTESSFLLYNQSATDPLLLFDHWIASSRYRSPQWDDLTMVNLFDATDMTLFPYEYLNDSTHYSVYNKIDLWEAPSPLHLVDSTLFAKARDRIFKIPNDIYVTEFDSTSSFFVDMRNVDATWCDNTANWPNIAGRKFTISDKWFRVRADRESMLLPVWSKSWFFRDSHTFSDTIPSVFYAAYTVRYLKKESLDWFASSDFTLSYKQFFDNLRDLTTVKYNQHWFVWKITLDGNGFLTSKEMIFNGSVTDQTMFDITDNLDGRMSHWQTSSQRLLYNHNDFDVNKFMLSHCKTVWKTSCDNIVQSLDGGGNWGFDVTSTPNRYHSIYDFSNNHRVDFSYAMPYDRKQRYKVPSSVFTYTNVMNSTTRMFPEMDATHIAPMDFVQSFVLGFEDQVIVNLVPTRINNDFVIRDLFTNQTLNAYNDKIYQGQELVQCLTCVCMSNKITMNISDGKTLKYGITENGIQERPITRGFDSYQPFVTDRIYPSYYIANGSYVSTSQYLRLDDQMFYDDVHGASSYGTKVYSLYMYPNSDITAWSSPSGVYNAKPSTGTDYVIYNYSTLPIFDKDEIVSGVYYRTYRVTHNYYRQQSDYTSTAYSVIYPLDGGMQNGQSVEYNADECGMHAWSYFQTMIAGMTPFDVLIKDQTSSIRRQTNPWFSQSPVDISCVTTVLDVSTIFPSKMVFKYTPASRWKWNTADYQSENTGWNDDLIRNPLIYSFGWLSKSQKSAAGINNAPSIQSIRDLCIDSSTYLLYSDRQNLNNFNNIDNFTYTYATGIATNSGRNSEYGWYHHRTPSICAIGNDTSFSFIKQNALFDMLLYHFISNPNGQIVPNIGNVAVSFDIATLSYNTKPVWNRLKGSCPDVTAVSVTLHGDRLYAVYLTDIAQLSIDPTLLFSITGRVPYSRNLGLPAVQLSDSSMAPSNGIARVMSLGASARKWGFEHCLTVDVSNEMQNSDLYYNVIDHSCEVEFDFLDSTLSISQIRPDKTMAGNQFYTNYDQDTVYLADFTSDYTTWSPIAYNSGLYYTSKNAPDYSSASIIWDTAVPVIDDLDFENRTAIPTADQNSRYLMSRIRTDADYVINNSNIISVDYSSLDPSWTNSFMNVWDNVYGKYTPALSKAELIKVGMSINPNKYLVVKIKNLVLLFDGSDRTNFYGVFGWTTQYGWYQTMGYAKWPMNMLSKIIPSKIGSINPYFRDIQLVDKFTSRKILTGLYNYVDCINPIGLIISAIKSSTLNPFGNMYLITDFDSDLLEYVFNDLIG